MASQKGGNLATLIGLILAIFVVVILVFISIQMNTQIEQLETAVKTAERDKEDEIEKQRKVGLDRDNLRKLIHGSTDDVSLAVVKRDYLDTGHSALKKALDQEKESSSEMGTALRSKGQLEDKPYTNLLSMYRDYERIVASIIPELMRLRSRFAEADSRAQQVRNSGRDEKKSLDGQIDSLRQEKNDIENAKIEEAKNHDAEVRRLHEEKEQVSLEMEEFREQSSLEVAKRESVINKLQDKIKQLTEKERRTLADTDSDGEIVHANHRLGKAWINIGRNHRLRRGLPFEVFQYIKGGKRKRKGMIEVLRVEDERAEVAIVVEFDRADPIVKGDFISSPLFDANEDMVFTFVPPGGQLTDARYDMQQLRRRIEEFGGRVDDSVSIETDFVIAIKDAESSPEFDEAVQFGVVIMRERELLEFLGQ